MNESQAIHKDGAKKHGSSSVSEVKKMQVIKRNGKREDVSFNKILDRISRLCGHDPEFGDALPNVDYVTVSQSVITQLANNITTVELDELSAEACHYKSSSHLEYETLASRIAVSNMHKSTTSSFGEYLEQVYSPDENEFSLLSDETFNILQKHLDRIEGAIQYKRDYNFSYFGLKTLLRAYLYKKKNVLIERPQHMFMRVSAGIHGDDIENIIATYDMMSQGYFVHATPTLFNSGTRCPQMSSCFLLDMESDSIEGIYETMKQCAVISKFSGGIGFSAQKIRANGSSIKSTNGNSNGIIPMARVFNNAARHVDQGGGKRKGAFAMYIEPHHKDVIDWLDLKKNHGNEEMRARDLFYGLWVSDLFMKRVMEGGKWTLFSPHDVIQLENKWGDEFEDLYIKYENDPSVPKTVIEAQWLMRKICIAQIETGTPFMLYKDACNRKSNQQNLGCIKSSNLCTEIIEYSSSDEIAVCNLASIGLPKFVYHDNDKKIQFDFHLLSKVVRQIVFNINKVIDRSFYPLPQARKSNVNHRPMGIGVQGLADVFMMMEMPYESDEASELDCKIFETIYFAALSESCHLAKTLGKTYNSYKGSPLSKGLLQMDLWTMENPSYKVRYSGLWDWKQLRNELSLYGAYNSLLVAPMPTASTSQILGNFESFDPMTSNIFVRKVLAGDFNVINQHLFKKLVHLGLWSDETKQNIVRNNGSVANLDGLSLEVKAVFKTAWEMKQRNLVTMASRRGCYIDQSMSFNAYMAQPTEDKVVSMHMYAWKSGLKTGMYYLRSRAAANAAQVTVSIDVPKKEALNSVDDAIDGEICRREEGCLVCSS